MLGILWLRDLKGGVVVVAGLEVVRWDAAFRRPRRAGEYWQHDATP